MLKGFTILEMLVVMALTSVLFAAGFYGYQLISLQLSQMRNNQERILESQQFLSLINDDINKSTLAYQNKEKIILTYPTEKKIYSFQDSIILRKQLRLEKTDTFRISSKTNNFIANISNKPTETIAFDLLIFGKPTRIFFSKKYSSENLINIKSSPFLYED